MPTFDGPNLTITLDSGVLEVDVQEDLYEPWKQWVRAGNSQFPAAFRTVGGDPLSSIINAGAYFFLNNSDGWRIKPPEEDITVYVTGNLAVEDTTQEAFIPTTGNFTAAILGLQPVTQGVTASMKEQLEFAAFNNGVWVDQANGVSGTGYTASGKPLGTPEDPVNNIPDAVAIDTARGLPQKLYVIGDLTMGSGDDVTGFQIVGQNAQRTTLTLGAAATITNVDIQECTVTGTLDGSAIIRNGHVYDIDYFSGFIFQCQISGTITLGSSAQANILQCYSGVPGAATPTIDMGGSGQSLSLRDYSGGVLIENKTGSDAASIDLQSGQIKIDLTTVTAGSLVARGVGKVIDAADESDYLLTGTYGSFSLINETNTGVMLSEIWQRLGMDPDAPVTNNQDGSFTVGGITVDASEDGNGNITQTRQ